MVLRTWLRQQLYSTESHTQINENEAKKLFSKEHHIKESTIAETTRTFAPFRRFALLIEHGLAQEQKPPVLPKMCESKN